MPPLMPQQVGKLGHSKQLQKYPKSSAWMLQQLATHKQSCMKSSNIETFRMFCRVRGITHKGKSQERAAFKMWLVLNREFREQLEEIKETLK